MVIGVVGAIAIGGTTALFNDIETATANTISTGTINISVDGKDPWKATGVVNITDLKPCQNEYAEYTVKNIGNNPANIFKMIKETVQVNGTDQVAPISLAQAINYDMTVWVYKPDPTNSEVPSADPVWWQVIYTNDMGFTLASKDGQNILLGMLPVGWFMKIQQSYHMDCQAGNGYQNKSMNFDITLTAEQLVNTVTLQDKIFPDGEEPTIVYDQPGVDLTYGTVAYSVKEKTFDYNLTIENNGGVLAPGAYTLIAWEENGNNFDWGSSASAIALANINLVAGTNNQIGSLDLNQDLINAKLWLIHGTYAPLGSVTGVFPWNKNGLFETALMDYYDSLTF